MYRVDYLGYTYRWTCELVPCTDEGESANLRELAADYEAHRDQQHPGFVVRAAQNNAARTLADWNVSSGPQDPHVAFHHGPGGPGDDTYASLVAQVVTSLVHHGLKVVPSYAAPDAPPTKVEPVGALIPNRADWRDNLHGTWAEGQPITYPPSRHMCGAQGPRIGHDSSACALPAHDGSHGHVYALGGVVVALHGPVIRPDASNT